MIRSGLRNTLAPICLLLALVVAGCTDASADSGATPVEAKTNKTKKPTTTKPSKKGFVTSGPQTLDPAPLDRVLKAHLKKGRMDYAALKKDAAARKDLDAFVAAVGTMPEAEPLSSWINAYNALVIHSVLQHYPIKSVNDVPGFFKSIKYKVAGKQRTLDDVENGVIRPRFKDARVHVALNCGAVSCPELPATAFDEATMDKQLTALAKAVVNGGQHVAVKDGKLEMSVLFGWFKDDFVRDAGSLLAWFKRYADTDDLKNLPDDAPVVERPYDWALADAK